MSFELDGQVQGEKTTEQKLDEVHQQLQEIVLGYDFNNLFDNSEANKIIHTLLYEQAQKYIAEIDAKDADLKAAREGLAQKANDLQASDTDRQALQEKYDKLQVDYEESQKDARYQLNEATRLKLDVDRLNQRLADLQKQRTDTPAPSESLAALIENAKQAKAQKRQLINVRQVTPNGSLYAGEDENGQTVQFSWLEKNTVEEVKAFDIPSLKLPDVPAANPEPSDKSADAFQGDSTADQHAEGAGDVAEAVPGTDVTAPAGEVAPATSPVDDEIEERFKRIEEHLGLADWKAVQENKKRGIA